MIIKVKVKTRAKENSFMIDNVSGPNCYLAKVKAIASKGAANLSVVRLAAEYFRVMQGTVRIKSGAHTKVKILEINID